MGTNLCFGFNNLLRIGFFFCFGVVFWLLSFGFFCVCKYAHFLRWKENVSSQTETLKRPLSTPRLWQSSLHSGLVTQMLHPAVAEQIQTCFILTQLRKRVCPSCSRTPLKFQARRIWPSLEIKQIISQSQDVVAKNSVL